MTRQEWTRLGGLSAAVLFLHVLGFGLFFYYLPGHPELAGLATLAYTFGLRHAFDADHIAAIDNTTRKLLQDGKRPLGTGFFFSLGHSSIVFALATGLALGTQAVNASIPSLQRYGGFVGTSVSGTFLWLIGILNLIVLVEIVRLFLDLRQLGDRQHVAVSVLLLLLALRGSDQLREHPGERVDLVAAEERAGRGARLGLGEHAFKAQQEAEADLPLRRRSLPAGVDLRDRLVERASAGCPLGEHLVQVLALAKERLARPRFRAEG